MLKTQIVECSAVANWLFSNEMQPQFTRYVRQGSVSVFILCNDVNFLGL